MRLGVECGGTFTDLVLLDDAGRLAATGKVFSTPSDPSLAVLEAIGRLEAVDLRSAPLLHGSTVATNAVLERKGPRLGLIVTRGFRDVLELQRHDRDVMYDLHYRKPRPLVRRELVREVPERLDATGKPLVALDEQAVRDAVAELAALGVTSIAVCFLHSYRNPTHEQRVREIVSEVAPALDVSLSSEVVAEFREYERASSTTVDAFVKPTVDGYLSRLERSLAERGMGELSMMQSNGGVVPAAYVRQRPIHVLLSGPAAGVAGAVAVASAAGIDDIVTMDMGGTSTDVCLVTGGRPQITTESMIDRIPVKLSMVDIATVGAGGGSIVGLDPGGMLQVGPRSAGADPGPACYGRGGAEPTVTDANVTRGLIRPGHFLGGRHALDRAAATTALGNLAADVERTSTPGTPAAGLKRTPAQLAEDVFRIANVVMAGAIRLVSTERGHDPRDHTLVAYGGAGPLHAAAVADELGIKGVLVPPHAGLMSAYGLLSSDFQRRFAVTRVDELAGLAPGELGEVFGELLADARAELAAQGVGPAGVVVEHELDLRYRGQGFELTVPVPPGVDPETAARLFHEAHALRYGHSTPAKAVQVVTYRLTLRVPSTDTALPAVQVDGDVRREDLPVVIGGEERTCAFLWRASLPPGYAIAGPAVVEEDTATTFVPPGWTAAVDRATNLVLTRGA
ncbi:hydantoinase/oxoprolinase family protein [Nonomuraea sp. LPB2021202275-12-8]|uniref:hydantoinase/oxoprolinase family protein n=1 Tax=Nonomuraea sp. LPB2021202275-12-8 TaxID=3120159 RepID=UPI00300C8CF1